ncbi:hypothetical protein Tco_0626316 [Tanacetum coccineum]|uniref:Uncharacterized protein n=1 Tax=Tanacetum coccineum TaxID=301880 RepID=A0ABQ4WJ87_9ASTR
MLSKRFEEEKLWLLAVVCSFPTKLVQPLLAMFIENNIQEYVSHSEARSYLQPRKQTAPQIQGVSKEDFHSYVKANDAVMRNMQTQDFSCRADFEPDPTWNHAFARVEFLKVMSCFNCGFGVFCEGVCLPAWGMSGTDDTGGNCGGLVVFWREVYWLRVGCGVSDEELSPVHATQSLTRQEQLISRGLRTARRKCDLNTTASEHGCEMLHSEVSPGGEVKLEGFLKRRNLVLTDSEEEEPEVQGRKSQDDPLDSSVQGLVTPPTTKVNTSGEEQVEEISPNTLEAAKTLSKVASLKSRSIDKGRRYKRRKETKGKKVVSSLDFQEEVDAGAEQVNTASAEQVSTAEGVNTGSIKLSTVSEQVSTGNEQVSIVSAKKSTSSQDKGQREGKAPMLSEETPKKSKEQILQEEASLAEAIRLDTLQKEEVAKQVHLDSLLAQRIAEEEELNEQQKKRKAQVQFEAQHYTNEDWDLIRAKIEANAELSKSMLGSELQGEDFAKKMVDLVNQRKKYFAEERARAKRNKPMTQSQLKTYMMNYLKNQGTWKLSQLKKLSFEEVKEEFDKLVKQVESFAPISFEATKASLKRFVEELQTKLQKA